jgi:hypothetical protein
MYWLQSNGETALIASHMEDSTLQLLTWDDKDGKYGTPPLT